MTSKLNLQDSLVISMSNVLVKKPDQRSTFDHVVVQEVEKVLMDEVTRLRTVVAEGDPASVQRASAVEAARADVQAAEKAAEEVAGALEAAKAVENDHVTKRAEAAKELKLFMPSFKEAVRSRDSLQVVLDTFDNGPFASYQKLRDFVSTPQEPVSVEAKAEDGPEPALAEPKIAEPELGDVETARLGA